MAPCLRVLTDGEVHRSRQLVDAAADLLGVTLEQRQILNSSGKEVFRKRGGWALFHLARARAVERPVRGHYRITDIGRRLLASHPDGITEGHL
ncbi:MAG: winged helix-turn-helix domain-containing protein, partial [Dermatophilaceae bacterium]